MTSTLDAAARKAVPRSGERDPLVLLFGTLALALALARFVALGRWGLWLDEALTLADAPAGGNEANPFGYRLFAWFYALAPARPDERWMRLPAAFFGLAAVPATFWAFRPALGARAAALGAFFLAASTWHLYWSQSARFYTLAQTLALLGGGTLLRGLARGLAWRTALGLALLALAALTHPSAAFVCAPLLLLPWIGYWLEWVPPESQRGPAWPLFATAGLAALAVGSGWALKTWLRWEGRQGTGSFLHFAKTAGYLITPSVGLALLVGLARGWRGRATLVPVGVAALGLAAAAFASLFVRVSAQYVFVLQPWIAATAGLAFAGAPADPARRRRLLQLAVLVALPSLVEMALYFTVRHGDRPRWREAYAYVFEHRGPNDLVLGMEAPVAEYYLEPSSSALRRWTHVTWLDDFRGHLVLDWARYGRRTWFVVNATQLEDWTGTPGSRRNRAELERVLREECEPVASFPVPFTPRDLDVDVYVTRAP